MTPQPDLIALLSKILAGTPKLDGAACIGRHHLFDPPGEDEPLAAVAARHSYAAAVCASCSVLIDCDAWATTERRYAGVLAGRIPQLKQRGRPAQKEAS